MLAISPLLAVIGFAARVAALGKNCTAAVTEGTASASDPYWLEGMSYKGTSAFNTVSTD